ncbi:MAG: toxin HicA [Elusimicrobia bacterium CG06_land_8_20_14_3_00_38_11]|nr:MAG: toxin HicA [Elusimicrobia bacterium CG06_land_8_20_14_3_00_38_11]
MGRKILEIILSGLSDKNTRFNDLRKLLLSLGFAERIKGSHHIFTKSGVIEIINIQPLDAGKSKPYQVKQVRNLILKYKIHEGVLKNGQI